MNKHMRMGLIVALLAGLAPRAEAAVSATGGNYTNDIPGYRIHVFTNSATASNFVVSAASAGDTVQVLVVGGGGAGGGGNNGGGGGAGGFIYSNGYSVVAGSNYTVTVGVGGPANAGTTPVAGSNSVFGTITATGGGGGGGGDSGQGGGTGGSGGGGAYSGLKGTRTPSPIQGNDGADGVNATPWPGGAVAERVRQLPAFRVAQAPIVQSVSPSLGTPEAAVVAGMPWPLPEEPAAVGMEADWEQHRRPGSPTREVAAGGVRLHIRPAPTAAQAS
jgi:hypothetical protein